MVPKGIATSHRIRSGSAIVALAFMFIEPWGVVASAAICER